MKLFFACVGLLALTSTAALAQTPKTLDEQYGFRNAHFETDTAAYRDLTLAESAGRTRYYRRLSDSKMLGEAKLADITYGFYKGKLAVVMLKTQGSANSRAVLAALREQAGPGLRSSPFVERYSWAGKAVHMSYDENAASNDAVVLITCKKIKEAEMKEALRRMPASRPPSGS